MISIAVTIRYVKENINKTALKAIESIQKSGDGNGVTVYIAWSDDVAVFTVGIE